MTPAISKPIPRLTICLAVALGCSIGALSRFWSTALISDLWVGGDLAATAFVNILGSFIIGLFATVTTARGLFPMGDIFRQFIMAGFCGGYTTRSLMGLESFMLMLDHHMLYGAFYVIGVVLLSLMAAAGGYGIGRKLSSLGGRERVDECRALS